MADSENIGSISVSITGDYSDLITAFQEAVQLAADSGKRIADALTSAASSPDMSGITDALATINADTQSTADAIRSGLNDALQSAFTAPDTSGVTDAVSAVGQVADTVTQQLSLFDAAVHTPVDDAAGQLDLVTAAIEPLGGVAEAATAGVQTLAGAEEAAGAASLAAATQLDLFNTAAEAPYADSAGQLNLFTSAMEPFTAGTSKAEAAIQALNEADAESVKGFDELMAGANAAATAADNYAGSVADVMNRQKDADEALEQARDTVEKLKAMVDEGTASDDALARAERDLEKATRDASGAVRESGDAAHEAHGHVAELLESLLAFGGIEVTLGALKEFATEASEISAHAERIRGALGLMTGSAQTAAEMMEHLKDVSQELSVPIESLETMSRKLVAAGADVSSVDKAVRAAADAAAATGNDFDTIASKIAQIGLTGVVSAKNLKDLGLNTKDMADVMNTSVEDVKKTLVAEDIGGVIETLSETVSKKFPGAAKEMADDTQGQLTRVANQWHDLKEQVGDAINPILVELLPKLGDGLKGLIGVGAIVVTGLKEVIDVIVGLASASGAALDGFVSAIGHITTGDFKGAVQALKDGFDNTKAASQATWAALTKDVSDGVGTITKLYGDQAKAAGESADKQEGASKQTAAAAAAAATAAIAAGEEFKREQKAAEEFASSALEFLHKIPASYEEYLRKLSDGGATAEASIKQLQTLLDKATETASKMAGAPLAEMQQYIDKLTKLKDTLRQFADSDAFTKLEDHFNTLQAKFPELGQAAYDTFLKIVDELSAIPGALAKATPELIRMQDAIVEAQAKLEEQAGKTQAAFDKVWLKFLEDGQNKVQPITVDIRTRLDQMGTDGSRAVLAVADAMHETGIKAGEAQVQTATFIAALETIGTTSHNITLADEEFGKVASRIQSLTDKDIPNLIKATEDYKNDVVKSGLIIGDQLTREEAATRLQITALEEAGKNATEYKIKLQDLEREHENVRNSASVWDDIRVKLDRTKTSIGELKDRIAGDFVKGYQAAFKGFSDGLVDLAFDGGKFGDKMEGIFKNIGKSIAKDLLQDALTPLKDALVDLAENVLKKLGAAFLSAFSTKAIENAGAAVGQEFAKAGVQVAQSASTATTAASTAATASSTAASAASGAASAASGVLGAIGAVGAAVGAVAGVISVFQNISMSTDLGHIEENTRIAAIHLREFLNQKLIDIESHTSDGVWYALGHLVNIENVLNDLNSAVHSAGGMVVSGSSSSGAVSTAPSSAAQQTAQNTGQTAENTGQTAQSSSQTSQNTGQSSQSGGQTAQHTEQTATNTANTAVATAGVKASADQSAEALKRAQASVDDLKAQQAELDRQIVAAVSTGDAETATKLTESLSVVDGKLQTANGLLDLIKQATSLTASQQELIVQATAKAFGPEALKPLIDTIDRLRTEQGDLQTQLAAAVKEGDTELAASLAVRLDTVNGNLNTAIGQFTDLNAAVQAQAGQSAEVVAATQAMEAALKSGDIKAISDAAAQLQTAMEKQPDAIAQATAHLTAAIMSGNTKEITAALSEVQAAIAANAKEDTARQTSAKLDALQGMAASIDEQTTALKNTKDAVDALKGQQRQLFQDLIIATASGDTDLIAAIQTQLGIINGDLQTAQSSYDQLLALIPSQVDRIVATMSDVASNLARVAGQEAGTLGLPGDFTATDLAKFTIPTDPAKIMDAVNMTNGMISHFLDAINNFDQAAIDAASASGDTKALKLAQDQKDKDQESLKNWRTLLNLLTLTLAATGNLTPAQLKTAKDSTQQQIDDLTAQQTQLNKMLVLATDPTSRGIIQGQLNRISSDLSAANTWLATLNNTNLDGTKKVTDAIGASTTTSGSKSSTSSGASASGATAPTDEVSKQQQIITDLNKQIGDLPEQMRAAQQAGNLDLAYQISLKLQPLEFALHTASNALFTAQSQQEAFKETYGTPSTVADFDKIIAAIKPQLQYAIDNGNKSLIDQLNAQLTSLNQQRDAVIAARSDTSSTSTHTADTATHTATTAKNTDPPVSTKPVTDQVKTLDESIRGGQMILDAAIVTGNQGQIAAATASLDALRGQRDVLVNSAAYAKENTVNTSDTAKNTDVTAKNTATANVGIEAQLIAQRGIQDSAAKTQTNTGDAAKSVHDTADGVRQMQDPTAKTAANTSASGPISSAVVEVHALISQTQADLTGAVTRGDTAQVAQLTIQLAALQALGASVDTVATATGDNTSVLQTIPDQIAMAMKGANDAVIGGLMAIAAAIAAIQPSVTNNYYTSNYSSIASTVITNQTTSPAAAAASGTSTQANSDVSTVGGGSGARGGRGFAIGGYDPTGGWSWLDPGEYVLTPEQVAAVSPRPLTSLHEQMDILSIAKMAGERSFDVGGYDPTGGWRLQHPGEYVLTAGEVSQLPIAPLTSLHQKMDLSALMPAAPSASELRGLAVSPPPAMGQQMDFSSQSGRSGSGGGITINNLSLPGVKNVREFVKEMQDLYKQLSPKTHILSA